MKNSNWNSLVDQSLCKTEITKRDCTSEIYPFLKEIISPTPSTIYRFVWYKKAPDITTLVVVNLHCVLDLALRSIRAKNEDLKAFLFVEIVWNWLNFVKFMFVDIHFTDYFISFATSFSTLEVDKHFHHVYVDHRQFLLEFLAFGECIPWCIERITFKGLKCNKIIVYLFRIRWRYWAD